MPIIVGHQRIADDIAGDIARLETLINALESLGSGEMPTTQELANAPLLDPYAIGTRPVPCLIGGNEGHPNLSGPVVRTSELWVLAPHQQWARTLSRLYRLGEPARVEGHHHAR